MESASNRPLSSAKWSRNLSENSQAEANRLRMMERQRQILENKLQRRHQQSASSGVTMSRPSTSGPVRARTPVSSSVISTSSGLSVDARESQLDDSDFEDLDDYDRHEFESAQMRSKSSIVGTRKHAQQSHPSPVHSPSQNTNVANRFEKNAKSITKKGTSNLRELKSMSRSEVNLRTASLNSPNESFEQSDHSPPNMTKVTTPSAAVAAAAAVAAISIPSPNPLTTILTEEQLRAFVSEPVSSQVTMQCLIIRDKKGFDRSLYPTYYMHLQDIVINHQSGPNSIQQQLAGSKNNMANTSPDGRSNAALISSDSIDSLESIKSADDESSPVGNGLLRKTINNRAPSNNTNNSHGTPVQTVAHANKQKESSGRKVFMLSGRRRKKSKTYLIGNNAFDISRQHSLAKLKSNVLGTQFTAIRIEPSGGRHEVVSVTYETNVLGFKGPRKMTVIVPKPDEKANPMYNLSLQEEYRRNSRAVTMLKNKTPIWNEETQSYVLNFHGRVTQASVKNFQLVPANLQPVRPSKPEMQRSTSLHQLRHNQNSSSTNSGGANNQNSNTKDSSKYVDDDDESEEENDDDSDEDVQYENDRKARQEYASTRPMSKSLSKSGYLSALSSEDAKQLTTDPNEHVSLQFGRVSDTHFSCDVSWPLSLIQAFAIALSSFDSKLACE